MLCGRSRCPIQSRIDSLKSIEGDISKDSIFGASPPSVFVGRSGYPEVRLGPMVPPVGGEEGRKFDDPKEWFGKKIDEVIDLRTELVRSNFQANVRSARRPDRLLDLTQELAMSSSPVDTEVKFKKPPKLKLSYDGVLSPVGPTGEVERADLAENPDVDRSVDYLVSDTDVLASDALLELHGRGIDVYQASRLMSAGLLGRDKDRKLVPTRWSITAVDSQLSRNILETVKRNQQIREIQLYSAKYLGNHFEILMVPDSYSFELIEIWRPKSVWTGDGQTQVVSDHENRGSKSGYSPLGGGYYATRLPILEHFRDTGRQGLAIAVREVSSDYWAPLGVWVVRETARHALSQRPRTFETVEGAVNAMAKRLKTRRDSWTGESILLQNLRNQLKLERFLES